MKINDPVMVKFTMGWKPGIYEGGAGKRCFVKVDGKRYGVPVENVKPKESAKAETPATPTATEKK